LKDEEKMSLNMYIAPEIKSVIKLYEGLFDENSHKRTVKEQIYALANRLRDEFQNQHPGVYFEISNWHPALTGKAPQIVWISKLTEYDFLTTVAREMGYENIEMAFQNGSVIPNPQFEKLVDSVLIGDIEKIISLLQDNPDLINQSSHWGHKSTALHYVAANGVESVRQVVPYNATEVVKTLLKYGAKVNAEANMYGGGKTVLELLRTSDHPEKAGISIEIEEILLSVGAF
jgi:hypothetical protein